MSTLIPFLLAFFTLLSTTISSPTRHFSKIYAFGDSFTDTGNTHSITGPQAFTHVSKLPYGITYFHHSTNRYSDGRLVVDFLASELSLPFLPPYLSRNSASSSHGVNFAVAGSTAINHEFFAKYNLTLDITPQSISTQLQWFDRYLERKGCRAKGPSSSAACREAMEDALFWVGEIGVNDYAYSIASSFTPETVRDLAVKHTGTFLQALLARGAKYIMVQGLPLTGCLPLTLVLAPPDDRDELGCSAVENSLVKSHNSLIQAKLQELRAQHPAAVISYADYYSAHHSIIQNYKAFGFAEPFKACCGAGGGPYNFEAFATCGSPDASTACSAPSKFVNWDGVHLTEAVYRNIADMFFHRDYCKPSFDELLSVKQHRG